MFNVDFNTGAIEMNAGDTGSFEIAAVRSDGEPWTADDVATFTVRNAAGEDILLRDYSLVGELGNGIIGIEFQNSDTDDLAPGAYSWEMRYVVNALYDSSGELVDGDIVRTPGADGKGNPMTLTIKSVMRDI
jgi:hypothetical protein